MMFESGEEKQHKDGRIGSGHSFFWPRSLTVVNSIYPGNSLKIGKCIAINLPK